MIVPALLTDTQDKLQDMADLCSGFTDYVQVDIMDGKFVPSSSISADVLGKINFNIRIEAHLMAHDPLSWIIPFKLKHAEKIIFHSEADCDIREVIEAINEQNIKPGLAINPDTDLSMIEPFIDEIDTVLFMSVQPGFYGAEFIPEVLDKILIFRKKYPDKITAIDGGVKYDNIKAVAQTGVNYICVGSAVLKADSPGEAYRRLEEVINE